MKKFIKKNLFLVLVAILFALLMAYLAVKQYYPIAFVNNNPILNIEFQKSYQISRNYYENSLKADNQDVSALGSEELIKELKRAVLDALIEQKIIDEELNKRMKPEVLENLINNKISEINFNSDNFKKGAEALYGSSVKDVKNFVLIPKAKEEILEGRLILENEKFGGLIGWLSQKKQKLKVVMLLPEFFWDNGEVATK